MKNIQLTQKMIAESPLADFVFVLNEILNNTEDNVAIFLEKATYDLRTTYAKEEFCYISNNDSGLKSLAFFLENKKNVVIDGQGSHLNCIGRILPFYLKNCENIIIKNFTMDYQRPFMSQGEVLSVTPNSADIRIDSTEFPYEIRQNTVKFVGEDYENYYVQGMLEFYKDSKRPVADVFDNGLHGSLFVEELEKDVLRIFYDWNKVPKVGNVLVIKHEERFVPAITVDTCKDINLEHIWIKQAGTMGIIAQLTENIHLNYVSVYVDPSSQRVFSINADATHFVNCSGDVIVENGRFESMMDDVINVHGNYLRIDKVEDSTHLLLCIPHFQQEGFINIREGDKIAICEQRTMLTKGNSIIKSIEKINQKYLFVTLETPFDFDEKFSYCIENEDMHPIVTFRGNHCGSNRARGLILTSIKETIVENNVIDSEGSAIKVNSDMKNWYESAAISSLIIRNNKITRKNHGNWGTALIDIDPGMQEQVEGTSFHGNMVIENNEILLEESPLFFGYSFGHLQIKGNTITVKNNVKADDWDYLVQTKNSKKVEIEANVFSVK